MSTHNKIEFRGSVSPIMSAIRMGGDVMRISFDVPLTERENAIGLLALTDQPLRFTIQVDSTPASQRISRPGDKPEKRKKEPKGEYSFYWEAMHAKGFDTFHDLQEVLDCSYEDVHKALQEYFDVESLAVSVSPEQFERFVRTKHMNEGLITKSRSAVEAARVKQERIDNGGEMK